MVDFQLPAAFLDTEEKQKQINTGFPAKLTGIGRSIILKQSQLCEYLYTLPDIKRAQHPQVHILPHT